MDITLNSNIHTPEMTRFINGTYYRGRYSEVAGNRNQGTSFQEIIEKYQINRLKKEMTNPEK